MFKRNRCFLKRHYRKIVFHTRQTKKTLKKRIYETYRLFQKCPFLLPVGTEKIFFEGSSAAVLLGS